jgi:hypothetical protein
MVLGAALLAGCATSGPTGNEILTGSIGGNTARLVIYRSSLTGFAVQPDYLVDGKRVAGSQPNGFVVCHLPPGRHEVAVANLPVSINLFGRGSEQVTLDLRAGSTTYLAAEPQIGIMAPGKVTLLEVAESQGRADTAKLHQIDAGCGTA